MQENNIVYATDSSRHSLVKIFQPKQHQWKAVQLKRVIQVEVVFTEAQTKRHYSQENDFALWLAGKNDQRARMRYRLEWEKDQTEKIWNRDLDHYCNYFTYQPYCEKDVSKVVTKEMLEFVRSYNSHLFSWHIPTQVQPHQLVSINGFSLYNWRRRIVANKENPLAGFEAVN